MGYNVLSGSVSSTSVISSGSFIGDGAGLENVKQFELYNSGDSRIPFYKLVSGNLEFDGNSGFSFNNNTNALTLPSLTSSVGIKLSNPISGTLAGIGSYLGIDSNGSMVITSSAAGAGPVNSLQFHTGGGGLTGSSAVKLIGSELTITGSIAVTGSIYPSGSAIYILGSPTQMWNQIFLGSGSLHLGDNCSISTDETTSHHSIVINKRTEISGSGSSGEGLTLEGHLLPESDSLYDLGSPTRQWKSLYVSSSTVYFGGEALSVADGSLKFGSGSATKGFHIGHMHLLDRGIVMDPNRIFQMKAFQMQFHGGVAYKRNVVSWDYQVLKTDYMIGVQSDTLTASVKLILPDATACIAGQTFIFKDEGGNCHTHNIVISASNGDQIDGNGIITLESPYSSVNIYTNGDNKYFIY